MKTKLALACLSLVAAGLGYFGYSRLTNQAVSINEVSGPTDPYVALLLEPSFDIKPANTAAVIGLTIDTGDNYKITRAEIELTYPVDQCLKPKVTPGDFLTQVVASAKVNNGLISFIYASPAKTSINGSGLLAKITTGPTTGDCTLQFTQNTKILGTDNYNLLGSSNNALLKLKTVDPNLPSFKQPVYKPDTLTR